MPEQAPSNEQDPSLQKLIEVSRQYLKDCQAWPGLKYEPITIPLTWLFTRTADGVTIGYRVCKDFRPITRKTSSPDDQFTWGRSDGLNRSLRKRIRMSDETLRYVDLSEYQKAHLKGRQVVPDESSPLYRIKLSERDGEGPTSGMAESFIYSADRGLVSHYVSPHYKPEPPELEPLERAAAYLTAPDV